MAIACTGIFYLIVELRPRALDISAKQCVSSSNFYFTNTVFSGKCGESGRFGLLRSADRKSP